MSVDAPWSREASTGASNGRRRAEPRATYRLQLTHDFGFADAQERLDYFAQLGVDTLYLSPILQAAEGSTHGYDVADPTQVSEALGGIEGLRALASAAADRNMGLVVDIVPNHMAASGDNPLWDQLLAEGMSGPAGSTFDVDWRPSLPSAEGRVILPVLGDTYGRVLAAGEFELARVSGTYRLRYHDRTFPLRRETVELIEAEGGARSFAGTPGMVTSWRPLHDLLERQHYRLVHWRIGDAVVNYRRFFTIDELAAVRVEVPEVFERTHGTIIDLVADRVIAGLRVDHPDGLRDPERYLEQLRNRTGVWVVAEKILHPGERLPAWSIAGTTGYDFCNDVLGLYIDGDSLPALRDIDRRLDGGRDYRDLAVEGKTEVLDAGLRADLERVTSGLWRVSQVHPQARDVTWDWCRRVVIGTLAHFEVYRTYVDPETGAAHENDREHVSAAVSRARAADPDLPAQLWDFLEQLLTGEVPAGPAALDVLARFQQLCAAVTAKGTEDTAFYRWRTLLAACEVGADPANPARTIAEFQQANALRAERSPLAMLTTATHDTKRGEDTRLRMAAISEIVELWRDAVAACEAEYASRRVPPQSRYLVYQTLVGIWPLVGEPDATHRDRLAAYVVKAEREAGVFTTWTDPDGDFEDRLQKFARSLCDAEAVPAELRRAIDRAAEIGMMSGLGQVVLRVLSPGVPDTYQGTEMWDLSLVDPDNRRAVPYNERGDLLDSLDDADVDELLAERRDGRVKTFVLQRALAARAQHPACVGVSSGYLPLDVTGRWADHVVAFARVAPDGSDAFLVVAPRLPGAVMGSDASVPGGKPEGHADGGEHDGDHGSARTDDDGGAGGHDAERGDEGAVEGMPIGGAWDDTAVRIPNFLRGRYRDVFSAGAGELGDRIEVASLLSSLPVAVLVRSSDDSSATGGDGQGGAANGEAPDS